MPRLLEFLQEHRPDVVCLQETKSSANGSPQADLAEMGYAAADHSGGRWAGVALLAPEATALLSEGQETIRPRAAAARTGLSCARQWPGPRSRHRPKARWPPGGATAALTTRSARPAGAVLLVGQGNGLVLLAREAHGVVGAGARGTSTGAGRRLLGTVRGHLLAALLGSARDAVL